MNTINDEILRAANTALTDRSVESDELLQPKLIINEIENELKTLSYLVNRLETCDEFWFSAAFLTNSGVASLYNSLKTFSNKPNKIGKILVSDYLYFTQPEALERISKLKNIEARLHVRRNFHGKGYLFRMGGRYDLLIGSSNLTATALSTNKELNLHVSGSENGELIKNFKSFFEEAFNDSKKITEEELDSYRENYTITPRQLKKENNQQIIEYGKRIFEPNLLQIEATEKIKTLRNQGEDRALVVSATGTGKTILSAFDVRNFGAKRMLFVVHRRNIAQQAMDSYKDVFGDSKRMGMYSGDRREIESDFIFSTIQTISQDRHLERFDRDHFDYIIIDETHRAGAETYQKIMDYFEPEFLLGMTATPERTDGYNIFEVFNHNIGCEIRLHRAMREDLLCQFHYFGITDITVNGKQIDDLTDFALLVHEERIEKIISNIREYGCDNNEPRGLIFCSRVQEAETLSFEFNNRGFKTVSLSGSNSNEEREDAIRRLESNDPELKIDYIFTVDVFNEGIDIPKINQIIMLRPTQSAIIFVQQLGRGLRKEDSKDYLTVIDFIGNYTNNYMIPVALYGDNTLSKDNLRKLVSSGSSLIPGASTVNFDEIIKERIYESIDSAKLNKKKDLLNDYNLLKFRLGRIPMMTDFLDARTRDPYQYVKYSGSLYNFTSQVEENFDVNQLTDNEKKLLGYLCRFINDGVRGIESLILLLLIEDEKLDFDYLNNEHKSRFTDIGVDKKTILAAINCLNLLFFTQRSKGQQVPIGLINGYEIAKVDNETINIGSTLKEYISNDIFKKHLLDSIKYSLRTFKSKIERSEYVDGFVRYEKYERKDVFRILNWERNPVAQNVGGYMVSSDDKDCAIFVTYEKAEEITDTTRYEDRFISQEIFTYKSKNRRTLGSPEVKLISSQKENNIRLPLFLKKSDDEGISHYYMGELSVIEESIKQEYMGEDNDIAVVTFSFHLDKSVEENLYKYITN